MKIRKHKGNKVYKITWSQRSPRRVEPKLATLAIGNNPTAVRNAFLFGRDRHNITASIVETVPRCLCEKTNEYRPLTLAESQALVSLCSRL